MGFPIAMFDYRRVPNFIQMEPKRNGHICRKQSIEHLIYDIYEHLRGLCVNALHSSQGQNKKAVKDLSQNMKVCCLSLTSPRVRSGWDTVDQS